MSATLRPARATSRAAARTTPTSTSRRTGTRRRLPFGKTFATFLLLPLCLLMVFPFVWLLLTSLRPQNTVFSGPFFPESFTAAAYPKAWTSIEFPLHFWNSLWITAVTVAGVLLFATLSGYAFAKLDFPFKNTLYLLLLTTLMMPGTALIIPLYLELKSLGLLDTQVGLVVLYISGSAPFSKRSTASGTRSVWRAPAPASTPACCPGSGSIHLPGFLSRALRSSSE